MLKIAGDSDLLQETVLLKEVVARHPFGEYFRPIRCVELRCDENGPRIDLSSDDRVILHLSGSEKTSPKYGYILHHEFGHVYDRMDPAFQYSLEARLCLNGDQNKLVFVTDLWNTYIDGRLDKLGLFEFSQPPEKIHCFALDRIIIVDSVESYYRGDSLPLLQDGSAS